jgi:hypothetical protein
MNRSTTVARIRVAVALGAAWIGVTASAQTPSQSTPPAAATPAAKASTATPSLDQLSWLRGCWAGKVGRRDFLETWLPARGGMMVGISQSVVQEPKQPTVEKMEDYEYLRLEARPDGVYYVAIPSGKKEAAFKLTSVGEELGREAYTFTNPVDEFPQKIVYMRGKEGWLYAQVAGKVGNAPKEVTYPMHHVDCMTGANLPE